MQGTFQRIEFYHHPLSVCPWARHWNPACSVAWFHFTLEKWLEKCCRTNVRQFLWCCQTFWEHRSMNNTCLEERLTERAEHAKPSCMPEKNDRNKAAECDGVIQYAFSVCWGSECTAWLTSVWRRMCCNSPGGPIPPRGYTAQDAEMLPQQPKTPEQPQQEIRDRKSGNLYFSERNTLQVWKDRIPRKDEILNMFLLALPEPS